MEISKKTPMGQQSFSDREWGMATQAFDREWGE